MPSTSFRFGSHHGSFLLRRSCRLHLTYVFTADTCLGPHQDSERRYRGRHRPGPFGGLHRSLVPPRETAGQWRLPVLMQRICATLLLAVFFGSKFFDLKYAYGGAGLLFSTATVLLGFALVGFAQEAWVGLREIDLERQELSDKAR
jgi:hypothetical protein